MELKEIDNNVFKGKNAIRALMQHDYINSVIQAGIKTIMQ